jgi:CRP/FNR family cyclic AMP-dependent transcriptional regulator
MTAITDDLRRVPLFTGMTDAALEAVATLASPIEFADRQPVTVEGEPGEAFYLLLDGGLDVARGGATISHLGAGDFVGEISLIDGRPRTATTTAVGPTRALVVRRTEFLELMERFPPVRLGILMALTERVRRDERSAIA